MHISLHAHIIILRDEEDIERVTNDIVAIVPAIYNEYTQQYKPPDDPLQNHLYETVLRKQLHYCKTGGRGCSRL